MHLEVFNAGSGKYNLQTLNTPQVTLDQIQQKVAMAKNIMLIGPMGAGKSSIGKRLARYLQKPFFDSDHVLEQRTGVTISTIFELEGEYGFRLRETKILRELVQRDDAVIATGGGIILPEENHKLLRKNNLVVYLTANVETQIKRTRKDKKRPLLKADNLHATLQALARKRNPLYEQLADITIDTDQQSLGKSTSQLIKKLESYRSA